MAEITRIDITPSWTWVANTAKNIAAESDRARVLVPMIEELARLAVVADGGHPTLHITEKDNPDA